MSDTKLMDHAGAVYRAGPALTARKITLLGLIAATYFMVAGGPYGLEDLVQKAGYLAGLLALAAVPFFWSLPTALMVSELSSAIPEEGGYYAWVRRAMGPFWGFQEAWLSLAASVFDMAIYPTLFVKYLFFGLGSKLLADHPPAWAGAVELAMIAACVLANLRGARTVGQSSILLTVALLAPFAVLVGAVLWRPGSTPPPGTAAPARPDLLAGVLVALWNYMGCDNATTVAGEVDRPQRTYPLAMGGAVLLVTLTYVLPVLAAWRTGIPAGDWDTGSWVDVGRQAVGPWLGIAIACGGMVSALGMFNALVLSYSRVPAVLAEDGYLPRAFVRRLPETGAPWVAVLACAAAWSLALWLPLQRLFALDVSLYGLSLLLEFAALVVLRFREPDLPRPFRVPGGWPVALLLGVGPALLIGLAVVHEAARLTPEEGDVIAPAWALVLGAGLAALGPVIYVLARRRRWPADEPRKNGPVYEPGKTP